MKKILVAALLLAALAAGHELAENRATLVLRDGTHLSLTMYLSYPEALHQALAPEQPFAAFLAAYSSMPPEALRKELERAQSRFEAGTHVYLPEREAPLTRWSWPDAGQVQAMLQRRMMQLLVDPEAHTHEAPVEVHAELIAAREIASARAQFPAEWRKVLVVWFRPSQQWVEGSVQSAEMVFGGHL